LVFGIGTDIIEIARVDEKMRRTGGLKTRVFTPREIAYCEAKAKSAQHYAARFAAKEAFLKAIGTGWRGGYRFVDIEILNNEQGKPELVLQGKVKDFCEENGISGLHVTLSHIKDLAKAVVVLEKR